MLRHFLSDPSNRAGVLVGVTTVAGLLFPACGSSPNSGGLRGNASGSGGTSSGGVFPGTGGNGVSRTGGRGGVTTVAPDASTTCTTNVDCARRTDNKTACEPRSHECVDCTSGADCDVSHECVANVCRPIVSCLNSLACLTGEVCDQGLGRCVECASDADCDPGIHCAGSVCRPPCTSDKQCTPNGLLCDAGLGVCVACLQDADCVGTDVCKAGACSRPPCTDGSTACAGNAVVHCANGAFGTPTACPPGESCLYVAGQGTCAASTGSGGASGTGGATGSGGAGGVTGCGTRLDLWLVVDQSGSMTDAYDTGTKWDFMTAGIQVFADAQKAGVSAGMLFFPTPDPAAPATCCMDADCGTFGPCQLTLPGYCTLIPGTCAGGSGCGFGGYTPPAVSLTALPDPAKKIQAALAAHTPGGVSTLAAALEGGRTDAFAGAKNNPGGKTVLVLITDGTPGGCTTNTVDEIAAVAKTAKTGPPSIPTYVISIVTDPTTLEPVATAGGTTAIGVPSALTLAAATSAVTNGLGKVVADACAP